MRLIGEILNVAFAVVFTTSWFVIWVAITVWAYSYLFGGG